MTEAGCVVKKIEEKNILVYVLVAIVGVCISLSGMVMPRNASAVPTMDVLESESGDVGKNIPYIDVGLDTEGEYPEYILQVVVDDFDNIIYVSKSNSDTVSVIDGDTLIVSNVDVGHNYENIAVDEENNIVYVRN